MQINVVNVLSAPSDAAETLPQVQFTVEQESISLRDLIARSVEQQIADLIDNNERSIREAKLLLSRHYLRDDEICSQSSSGKISLPQPKADSTLKIDIAAEVERAHRSFREQHYVIFINGQQLFDLEESISFQDAISVKFVRLMPLVGG